MEKEELDEEKLIKMFEELKNHLFNIPEGELNAILHAHALAAVMSAIGDLLVIIGKPEILGEVTAIRCRADQEMIKLIEKHQLDDAGSTDEDGHIVH